MYRRYKDRVEFLSIYVREAHPVEGWRSEFNDIVGVTIKQPQTKKDRVDVARTCCTRLEMSMPLLVDEIDDRVGHGYSGMPDRLYIIDRAGKVAYKGGRGPFGFTPGHMEQSLAMLLLDDPGNVQPQARVPLMDEEEAWQRLPLTGPDVGKPLPVLTRALARTLPVTAAAMLELDSLHRASSPLEAKLRARMRWVAARANQCEFSQAQALADLRRAGGSEEEIKSLQGNAENRPETDRDALTFARKLTKHAYQVTDEEVAALIKKRGERQVVAMVLLLAHANFEDRLLLTLGVSPSPECGSAPLEVRLDQEKAAKLSAVARKTPAAPGPGLKSERVEEWQAVEFAALQRTLLEQKERPGRIRVPTWEEVWKLMPPGSKPPPKPIGIKWSLVCTGYQQALASGWSSCTRTFGQEAKLDPLLQESLFWVVTQSLQCFY